MPNRNEITSNMAEAERHTTTLRSALERMPERTIIKDVQSTIAGNSAAHEAIASVETAMDQIKQAVEAATSQLHLVATSFQDIDTTIGDQYGGDA